MVAPGAATLPALCVVGEAYSSHRRKARQTL